RLFVFIRVHSWLAKNRSFPRYIWPDFLQYALGCRSGHGPDEPGSQGRRESESWSYPTAGSSPRLELWRVGRAVVALGLLVPFGSVPALAIRRGRLLAGPVRLGVVPRRHCGA